MIRLSAVSLFLALVGQVISAPAYGQRQQAIGSTSSRDAQIPISRHVADVSFEDIEQAMSKMAYDLVQVRWVRDRGTQARFVGVRELLLHDLDPDGTERILVEPQALSGTTVSPDLFLRRKNQREDLYRKRAAYIFFYQGFGVFNAHLAEDNYEILPLARTEYLGRPVERVLIYPEQWDRSIWLLDLDAETNYPLISREFNNQAQLLSQVVVEEFKAGPDALTQGVKWWEPTAIVAQPAEDFSGTHGVLELNEDDLPPGYQVRKKEVIEDLLTGEMSYVTTMSDGVDNLFLIQRTGMDDPGELLDMVGLPRRENAVLTYIDLNVTHYYFVTRDATFQLMGRGSVEDLRSTMARIAVKAHR